METFMDYSKLRGDIRAKFKTEKAFAKAIGIGRVSLSKRLNNELEFTASEMAASMHALDKEVGNIPAYFFTPKVQKHELKQF